MTCNEPEDTFDEAGGAVSAAYTTTSAYSCASARGRVEAHEVITGWHRSFSRETFSSAGIGTAKLW